jgi:subtilisin family serine protease/N-acetylneuraminic acid mutarotase
MAGVASITLVAGLTLSATPGAAAAAPAVPAGQPAAVEPQVRAELAADGTTDFWVYLEETADLDTATGMADRSAQGWLVYERLTETADASQADLRAMLDAEGVDYQSFWIANTIKVTGDARLLDRIAARPEVSQITADHVRRIPEPIPAEDEPGDEPGVQAVEWGLDRINAPQVWSEFGALGEDIVVGAIDTGASFDHPAIVNQYRGNLGGGEFDHNYSWWDPSSVCGSPSLQPCDNNGHGTHVTGTMVGDDGAGNQIGVAPAARWIMAKGCESNSCSDAALLSSGQFILAPTDLEGNKPNPDLRPHIVNNSWGGGANTDPWYQPTVQAWVAAGIFPQFANGNTSPGTAPCGSSSNPGNLVESYAAGAFDINDNLAAFSNRGPSAWDTGLIKPNLSAPGVGIRSAWNDGGYNTISGTSMASPHVAGTVALMWSAAIALERDIDATQELLNLTAIDTEDLTCGGTAENNNMYGEGRLDAFAAVDQSPRGPTGALTGTVTDAGTGDPIEGATVTVTGAADRERTTGPDGTYAVSLPVGDYTVAASAFGYAEQTAQVSIAEDATTTQDFPMATVDSVTVSGQVTDGSGHGWPLYAEVRADGTPASTYTDPVTGEYSLTLPANATYTLVVESQYDGYGTLDQPVNVGDGDQTLDLSLLVDQCQVAPGYEFAATIGVLGDQNGLLGDYLDSQGIPSTELAWGDDMSTYDAIIVNRPGNPGQEVFDQFLADTDAAGTGVVFLDTWSNSGNGIWLLNQYAGNPASRSTGFSSSIPYLFYQVTQAHPVLDGFAVGDEIVLDDASFFKDHAWFDGYEGEGRTVVADAARADTGVVGEGIGVQERATNRHVLLSMHAAGPFTGPQFWHDDGAQVFQNALDWVSPAEFECLTVNGGLVLGQVQDLNTGDGVNGATVTSVDNPSEAATSFATPDDPALADGFYWLFSSLTGSHEFTASASRYVDDTQPVVVAADATVEADFALPAGQLAVEPADVSASLRLGQSANRTFTLTNTGTAPVELELSERRGSFEILGGGSPPDETSEPATGPGEVRLVEGYFTPTAEPGRDVPAGPPAQAGPAAEPWTDLANYPTAIMDNAAAEVDGKLYSFGGYNGATRIPDAYVYDPATGQWGQVASMPAERMKPEAVALDGRVYVLGGWDNAGTTHATVFVYDPATDGWSQAADMPAGRTAPGAAAVDGQLYVVGGCLDSANCATSTNTWRYDPGSDSWSELAAYPETTAWLGCAGLEGQLFCTGGTDGSVASTATYAYDPGSDSWTQRADLPYDNWAMAYAAASGQFVVSGGVTNGFSTVTNQGAAYDPATDTWTEVEPSNQTVYRMGSACGFYKVGGSTGGFTPTPNTEVHPGFAECVTDVDVPWLSVSPLTATLQPGDSVQVTVSMDATVEQPGTYTAGVGVRTDTPYQVAPVGVTMTVAPPRDWGKLTGTVTGVDCDGEASPLAGATVQVNGGKQQVTLTTGADGGYVYWLSVRNNPLTVIVAASGYVPQTRDTAIAARRTVVEDFALPAFCPGGGDIRPI